MEVNRPAAQRFVVRSEFKAEPWAEVAGYSQVNREMIASPTNLSIEACESQSNYGHNTRPRIKLPKLTLRKFNGDITNWITFWDSYESTIDLNPERSAVDKFNYLTSLVEKTAAETIAGLSVTSLNYEEAVALLKKRFGNPLQIVNKHMDQLLNLEPVTSYDIKSLRGLCDQVESNVRSLKSLGVSSSSYGCLLSSIMMSKLPQDLRLVVSRKIKDDKWNLEEVMKVIEHEIDARERAGVSAGITLPSSGAPKKASKELHTAAALLSSELSTACVYCGQSHSANSCRIVTSVLILGDKYL